MGDRFLCVKPGRKSQNVNAVSLLSPRLSHLCWVLTLEDLQQLRVEARLRKVAEEKVCRSWHQMREQPSHPAVQAVLATQKA
mmetsp:Transcript_32877/g.63674  ORF Transcript_32877/g.63674 Transcript_32877/m.63674 type:complete len:82 (-) Transcript_32877:59-304(-)